MDVDQPVLDAGTLDQAGSLDQPLPDGMTYDPKRGLFLAAVVARQLGTHRVEPRPGRTLSTCSFDRMSGNRTLGAHLTSMRPLSSKCAHRHLDETVTYVIAGHGWSEYRQDDRKPKIRFEWQAGDVYIIPCNAWHEHFTADQPGYTRKVGWRNSSLMDSLLLDGKNPYHDDDALYNQASRFPDRFDDQPDYFALRERIGPNRVRTNFISRVGREPLGEPDPRFGEQVAITYYVMGGHRTLDVALVGIGAGGLVRPHRSLAEESFYVLQGQGRTDLWNDQGAHRSVHWRAGDFVSPPFNVWRQHANTGAEQVRYLRVRNVFFERAMGIHDDSDLDTVLPDRLSLRLEAGPDA